MPITINIYIEYTEISYEFYIVNNNYILDSRGYIRNY